MNKAGHSSPDPRESRSPRAWRFPKQTAPPATILHRHSPAPLGPQNPNETVSSIPAQSPERRLSASHNGFFDGGAPH
jgi:hypothetical protein